MKIRTINPDEIEQAVNLHLEPNGSRFVIHYNLNALSGKDDALLLGAFDGQALVGMVAVQPPEDTLRQLCYLSVTPSMQNTGVVTALLQHALAVIDRDGYVAGLSVDAADNNARRLYERLGFVAEPASHLSDIAVMRRPKVEEAPSPSPEP